MSSLPDAADPVALAERLRALGIDAHVEADGRLALVHVAAGAATQSLAESRRAVVAAARDAGFTHVALEITDDPTSPGADVRRAQP